MAMELLLDLIDTLWNVKRGSDNVTVGKYNLDLIDTLWNVKFLLDLMVLGDRLDLIDTLWNVKIFMICIISSLSSI